MVKPPAIVAAFQWSAKLVGSYMALSDGGDLVQGKRDDKSTPPTPLKGAVNSIRQVIVFRNNHQSCLTAFAALSSPTVVSFAWSTGGKNVARGHNDGTFDFCDISTGEVKKKFARPSFCDLPSEVHFLQYLDMGTILVGISSEERNRFAIVDLKKEEWTRVLLTSTDLRNTYHVAHFKEWNLLVRHHLPNRS
jgi:hypothetical protein